MGGEIFGGGAYKEPATQSVKQATPEDIRKMEWMEEKDRQLKQNFNDFLVDYALGKVIPSSEPKLGHYAVVGFDADNKFIYVGCKEYNKDAAALRKMFEMNCPGAYGAVLEVKLENVPKVRITKK
ncbi:MAG: hypothetical protein PHC66_04915 [Candidatus Nanoarchaeia archaeon]|nr:hypothetical protein [Candidatus Nanoarchaeia archaeon]MDD5239829.1 hypothetical protein [Candidatus Nanoarchaeia archaeon]